MHFTTLIAKKMRLENCGEFLIPGGRIVVIEPNIDKFAVKLIAAGEKLLFMHSHFLDKERIADLFASKFEHMDVVSDGLSIGVCCEKGRKM